MPAPTEKHYFVINALGQSADRRGPFESPAAAHEWIKTNYHYPCWIVAAEYAGEAPHSPLNGKGVKAGE